MTTAPSPPPVMPRQLTIDKHEALWGVRRPSRVECAVEAGPVVGDQVELVLKIEAAAKE